MTDEADTGVSRRTMLAMSGAASAALVACELSTKDESAPLLVDDFYEQEDREDDAPSFTRAYAAGLATHKHVRLTAGRTYSFFSTVEIGNNDGWTPGLFGNSARIDVRTEAGGFRYRGIKSGQPANAARGFIRDLTGDANELAISNGVWFITLENGGGLTFDNVHGLNFKQGYGILNYRYADGGEPDGQLAVRNCRFSGVRLASTSDRKWYGFSDTGDLSSVRPGEAIPAGAARAVATINRGNNGVGMPRFANSHQWRNLTADSILVPPSLAEGDLISVGLTKGAASPNLNGTTVPAVVYDYYSSGGTVLADCIVQSPGGLLENFECDGAYYAAYLSGVSAYNIRDFRSAYAIRGLACEWGAKKVAVTGIRVRESLSSAWLFGYNCPDCSVDNFTVEELTNRWVGEALSNVQLSAPRFTLGGGSMVTRNNVTDGQYFIKASVDCSDFEVAGPVILRGDCRKAYVCIESAYNRRIARDNPEHYAQSAIYDGGASRDMTGIRLRNIDIQADTVKAAAATALCLMQVADAIHGEIGLSDIVIENVRVSSPKHLHLIKFYEGGADAKQINGVSMHQVELPATASGGARMVLPRGRLHFSEVRSVTSLADTD